MAEGILILASLADAANPLERDRELVLRLVDRAEAIIAHDARRARELAGATGLPCMQ